MILRCDFRYPENKSRIFNRLFAVLLFVQHRLLLLIYTVHRGIVWARRMRDIGELPSTSELVYMESGNCGQALNLFSKKRRIASISFPDLIQIPGQL